MKVVCNKTVVKMRMFGQSSFANEKITKRKLLEVSEQPLSLEHSKYH